ncbi:MAG: methionyl-tRNA formyltransferase [Solirubrobacterales bacterium]|nr:methionyl-tRNA formyltransferase [Solirubrobacterales bacterium]
MTGVFIGTDAFAAGVLTAMMGTSEAPTLVITRPDSAKGRGRQLSPPPVALAAAELGVEFIQPEDIGAAPVLAAIDAIDPPALALCAYGAIIKDPLLSARPILNLHPSLLPRWRGAAPIERALMAGDDETGVSIIQLVEALDAGPVAAQESFSVDSEEDFASLSARLIDLGSRMLVSALIEAREGSLSFADQPTEGLTYAERIEAGDRLLATNGEAEHAARLVRALFPHIGARLELPSGDVVGVREASAQEEGPAEGVFEEHDGHLLVGFASGALRVTRLTPPGAREMASADWLRGRPDLSAS